MSHRSYDEQLLERLRIPFATFALDGSTLYLSPQAQELVSTDSPNLLFEISDMAKDFGNRVRAARGPVAPLEGCVTRPYWDHSVQFTLHAVETAGEIAHALCALVLLPPHSHSHSLSRSVVSAATPDVVERILVSRGLSQREREVAVLLWSGFTSAEIAARLNVTVHTARRHTEQVLRKLRITSRAAVGRVLANAAEALVRSQRVISDDADVISA